MKKILSIITFLFLVHTQSVFSQSDSDTTVYLLTCGPGTDTYSIYGHSAVRVVIASQESDLVYNWGVFDFSTPNFAWKFAKGRLDYNLGTRPSDSFILDYLYEQRFVYSQKINLEPDETRKLISLINENLKPENVSYRYDFFYDDCSTRIRDLLEQSIGKKLLYPPGEEVKSPTFRDMVGKYQDPYPWLKFGVDLIMGSSGDNKALYRDRMFLPIDLQNELVDARINRNGKMVPVLQNTVVILDFLSPSVHRSLFTTPVFLFTLLLIVIVILSAFLKTYRSNRLFDIVIFSIFSILALLMIFFNFFTDHPQMKWNLNIIWLNPLILLCLASLIFNKYGQALFRLLFIISVAFLAICLFLPQDFNGAFIPMVVIIIFRSSVRAGFEWHPYNLESNL